MKPALRPTAVTAIILLALLAALPACSAPQGSSGGRIDPYRTTESDRASNQASIPALLEFCDQTAQQLAQDLVDIPEIQESQTRVVLELGDLYNKTHTSTNDFELIQRRLRGQLLQSKLMRNQFKIVESRARMNREMTRVQGGDDDLLQEGTGSGTTAKYDPKLTYVLQGDFLESVRGARRQYYFEFKLTNLASRDIVFSKSFDLAQQ